MKLLITAKGKTLNALVDPRFGRATGFILYDTESKEYSYHDNTKNKEAGHGAGTNASQKVADLEANAVITFHVGDKAQKVLEASGIKIFQHVENISIQEAIDKFNNDELEKD